MQKYAQQLQWSYSILFTELSPSFFSHSIFFFQTVLTTVITSMKSTVLPHIEVQFTTQHPRTTLPHSIKNRPKDHSGSQHIHPPVVVHSHTHITGPNAGRSSRSVPSVLKCVRVRFCIGTHTIMLTLFQRTLLSHTVVNPSSSSGLLPHRIAQRTSKGRKDGAISMHVKGLSLVLVG